MSKKYDAIIIGSGINGISAAIYLQQKGLHTAIVEQASAPGGSTRTMELTLPGYLHDVGSAIHPMAVASPFLGNLPLKDFGLEWIYPPIPFAHPFLDGTTYACYQNIFQTAAQLGEDERAYLKLFEPLVEDWHKLDTDLLGPLGMPRNPMEFLKFGLKALPSARTLANSRFRTEKARLFFYGSAAHATLPLTNMASASFGLVLSTIAHEYGWPFPKGGAGKLTEALLGYYRSLGGELHLDQNITDIRELPQAYAYLFDNTPRQLLEIGGLNLGSLYRTRMGNFRYGAGVFKMDWALSEPIPFTNDKCRKAGTIHLGFSQKEIEASEETIHNGQLSDGPYVLLAQHSPFDPTRAPEGKHTAWAYCHVPNGSTRDCTDLIESQIERAAPGFRETILARSTMNTRQLHDFNPNIIGGDINGGKQDLTQLFTRPIAKLHPYSTPDPRVYICSSSTPPGGGVHGMCGYHAARQVLKDHFPSH